MTINKAPATLQKRRGHPLVPIDVKEVEKLASRGLTQEQIVDSLGISVQTFINRKKANIELMEAIKRGRASGLKEVTNALFDAAISGNVAAQIFFLKNRAPEEWRDKVDITVEENVPKPLVIEVPCIDVTPEPTPILSLNKVQDALKPQ